MVEGKRDRVDRFEQLEVWKAARRLTHQIYQVSREGSFATDFGLRDQIRRAAVSIMSNIAEGFERDSDREFARFLRIAKGSAGEVRSQLFIAIDNGYLDARVFEMLGKQCVEVSAMLSGLIRYLEASISLDTPQKPN